MVKAMINNRKLSALVESVVNSVISANSDILSHQLKPNESKLQVVEECNKHFYDSQYREERRAELLLSENSPRHAKVDREIRDHLSGYDVDLSVKVIFADTPNNWNLIVYKVQYGNSYSYIVFWISKG